MLPNKVVKKKRKKKKRTVDTTNIYIEVLNQGDFSYHNTSSLASKTALPFCPFLVSILSNFKTDFVYQLQSARENDL